MDDGLRTWKLNWTSDCDSLFHFSSSLTYRRQCNSGNVVIYGNATVCNSSLLSDLDIVTRDESFAGTVDCLVGRVDNNESQSVGSFTITGTCVHMCN